MEDRSTRDAPLHSRRAFSRRGAPFVVVALLALASALLPPGPARPPFLLLCIGLGGAAIAARRVAAAARAPAWASVAPLVLCQASIATLIYATGANSGLGPLFILAPIYSGLYGSRWDSIWAAGAGVAFLGTVTVLNGTLAVVLARQMLLWGSLLPTISFTLHALRDRLGVRVAEAEERSREISVLEAATRVLSGSLDPDTVLAAAARLAARLASPPGVGARRGTYFITAGETMLIAADSDETGASVLGTELAITEHPLMSEVMRTGRTVAGAIDASSCGPQVRQTVELLGVTHGAYVPVHVAGAIHGVLIVSSRGHAIPAHLVERLEALAVLTELALANALTHRLKEAEAVTDPLTGVANRRAFDEAVGRISGRRAFAFLIADIDGLKKVNDTYGHAAGDDLLKAVGAVLATVVRKGETLARLGGDEFAVVLADATATSTERLARRMRSAVSAISLPSGAVGISLGSAVGTATDDPRRVLQEADVDLYRNKRSAHARDELTLLREPA